MIAGRYDIVIEQGATFDLPLQYCDSDGVPVNLAGCNARMQIREAPASAVVVEFNSELTANGFIFLNGLIALLVQAVKELSDRVDSLSTSRKML